MAEGWDFLGAEIEVVSQVNFGLCSLLEDFQVVVLSSHIDVGQSKLDDDCPDVGWEVRHKLFASLCPAERRVEFYALDSW